MACESVAPRTAGLLWQQDTALPLLFMPRAESNLNRVESAFLNAQGQPHYEARVALGAISKANSCMDVRNGTGQCWGDFSGVNTAFVNTQDFSTSCAGTELEIQKMAIGFGQPGNSLSGFQAVQPSQFSTPFAGAGGSFGRSYASYSGSCVNYPRSVGLNETCVMTAPFVGY